MFSKLVLDDVGEDIFQFEAGCSHLLWDEAGLGHARRRVNLQQIDLVASIGTLGDDVVDADNAVAMQDVIDS